MKKTVRNVSIIFICTSFLFSMNMPVRADSDIPGEIPAEVEIDYSSEQQNVDGTATYEVVNAEEIAEAYEIHKPESVKVTLFNLEEEGNIASEISREYEIINVSEPESLCGASAVFANSSVNQSQKIITKNVALWGTASNIYSVPTGISASAISAGVGFDVTKSWDMSGSIQMQLKPGQRFTATVYPLYEAYSFTVTRKIRGMVKNVGEGKAWRMIGYCTVIG